MSGYILRRSLWAIPTMLGVMVFIFLVMRVLPGDPAYAILGDEAPAEALEQFRRSWGLHEPSGYSSAITSGACCGAISASPWPTGARSCHRS